jgi:Bacterial transcriptional activator domain/Protein kinase domain
LRAAEVLREGLALWRGPAYADLDGLASLQGEIARLGELRLRAMEDRIGFELAAGRHAEVLPELESLVHEHPLRERLWGHLMLASYRAGQQADALAVFETARRILVEELGIDPSPELRRLQEQILRQDPSLELRGRPLRGYQVLERIGEGAFGVVYRAIQPQVGREVAIKSIHSHLANDPGFIRQFEREAQLVARLEHPHVVPLYDYWRDADGAFLVMRFFRRGNLRLWMEQDGGLAPREASSILDQAAAALSAAQGQGIVHGDVKPENVLFDEEGTVPLRPPLWPELPVPEFMGGPSRLQVPREVLQLHRRPREPVDASNVLGYEPSSRGVRLRSGAEGRSRRVVGRELEPRPALRGEDRAGHTHSDRRTPGEAGQVVASWPWRPPHGDRSYCRPP